MRDGHVMQREGTRESSSRLPYTERQGKPLLEAEPLATGKGALQLLVPEPRPQLVDAGLAIAHLWLEPRLTRLVDKRLCGAVEHGALRCQS
jgi:hypothetical protein